MVKPYGGFYISHERSEGADPMWKVSSDPSPFVSLIEAVNETITIGRETGVPGRRVAPQGQRRELLGIEHGRHAADPRSA